MKNRVRVMTALLPAVFVMHSPWAPAALARLTIDATAGGKHDIVLIDDGVFEVTLIASSIAEETIFTLTPDSAEERLERVRIFSSNAGQNTVLQIGTTARAFRSIGAITLEDDQGYTFIFRLFTIEDVGSIEVNSVGSAIVGGDLLGGVRLRASEAGPSFLSLEARGDILGDILIAPESPESSGEITQLRAGGRIGTPDAPILIQTAGAVRTIVAGEIHAKIVGVGTEGEATFIREIGQIQTQRSERATGDITGEIRGNVPFLGDQGGIRAAGALRANVTLGFGLIDPFEVGIDIRTGAQGLAGQIIVNALDLNATWTAPVIVGSGSGAIVLDGDNPTYAARGAYPETSASLGGGSVALAPFALHRTDGFPALAPGGDPLAPIVISDMSERPSPARPIVLRYYGRVRWNAADGSPIVLEYRASDAAPGAPWRLIECAAARAGADAREVLLVPASVLPRGYDYRARLVIRGGTSILRSDLPQTGDDQDPPVADVPPLLFRVCGEATAGDADDDGCVDFRDVVAVLAHWGTPGCLAPGDADRDGDADMGDLSAVLMNWGLSGCGSCGR